MDNWEQCPRCNSARVREDKQHVSVGVGVALLVVLGIFLAAVSVYVGLALWIAAAVLFFLPLGKERMWCKDCQYHWKRGSYRSLPRTTDDPTTWVNPGAWSQRASLKPQVDIVETRREWRKQHGLAEPDDYAESLKEKQ